jgi:hypothetical protein
MNNFVVFEVSLELIRGICQTSYNNIKIVFEAEPSKLNLKWDLYFINKAPHKKY